MLELVEENGCYLSEHGYPCVVTKLYQHGQDCSIRMVGYRILTPTFDQPAGSEWVVEEGFFLNRFSPADPTLPIFTEHRNAATDRVRQCELQYLRARSQQFDCYRASIRNYLMSSKED